MSKDYVARDKSNDYNYRRSPKNYRRSEHISKRDDRSRSPIERSRDSRRDEYRHHKEYRNDRSHEEKHHRKRVEEESKSRKLKNRSKILTKQKEKIDLISCQNVDDEMTKLMGFGNFDTTKNKKVSDNVDGAVKINKPRKYRQYMNRKGGFNRPLDYTTVKVDPTLEFNGCLISLDCGTRGYLQGKVVQVDKENKLITIERPLKDGIPLTDKTLVVASTDIQDLKIIKMPTNAKLSFQKDNLNFLNKVPLEKLCLKQEKIKNSSVPTLLANESINNLKEKDVTKLTKSKLKITEQKTAKKNSSILSNLNLQIVPASVLSGKNTKTIALKLKEKSTKRKKIDGTRINVSELLVNKLHEVPNIANNYLKVSIKENVATTSKELKTKILLNFPNCKTSKERKDFFKSSNLTSRCSNSLNFNNSQSLNKVQLLNVSNGCEEFSSQNEESNWQSNINLNNEFDFDKSLALFDKKKISNKTELSCINEKNEVNTIKSKYESADLSCTLPWTKNNKFLLGEENALHKTLNNEKKNQKQEILKNVNSTSEFNGCLISLDCGTCGYLQGKVVEVDQENKLITIERPLKDGIPLTDKKLVVASEDIHDLKIIKMPTNAKLSICNDNLNCLNKTLIKQICFNEEKFKTLSISKSLKSESNNNFKDDDTTKQAKLKSKITEPKFIKKNSNIMLNFDLQTVPISVLSGKSAKNITSKIKEKFEKTKKIDETRINVSELLLNKFQELPCLSNNLNKSLLKENIATTSNNNLHKTVQNSESLNYKKFGEFRQFNGPEVPAPCRLNVVKRNNGQGPSGIPLVDFSNGYRGFSAKNAELGQPIDFNLLNTDFDFDKSFALFDKEKLTENDEIMCNKETFLRGVSKNFRNDENVLADPSRTISWTKNCNSSSLGVSKIIPWKGLRIDVNDLLQNKET